MRRSREPLLWALFSSGGMLAAFFLPAIVALLWIAAPLGWIDVATYREFVAIATHPVGRLFLFGLVSLSLFHWAHRFRFTLYDGLQLYHLNVFIAVLTYGLATILTVVAGIVVILI